MTARLVGWVAAAVVLVLVAVDVWLAADGVRGNTWSEVVHYWGTRIRFIPWCLGGLVGHFFAGGLLPSLPAEQGVPVLIWATVVAQILAAGFSVPPLVVAAAGMVAWGMLWPV